MLFNGVIIQEDVFIGPGVITTNDRSLEEPFEITKTLFRNGCKIGAGSIIIAGVIIGENSVIGAGSVVTKDIPADELWFGNPAKFVRKLKT